MRSLCECERNYSLLLRSVHRLDIDGKPSFSSYLGPQVHSRFTFRITTTEEITRLNNNLPTKHSAGVDGISSVMLKNINSIIAPALSIAINQSLHSVVFPSHLKIAKVIPLYKNKGSPNNFGGLQTYIIA